MISVSTIESFVDAVAANWEKQAVCLLSGGPALSEGIVFSAVQRAAQEYREYLADYTKKQWENAQGNWVTDIARLDTDPPIKMRFYTDYSARDADLVDFLPTADDLSFDGYHRRITKACNGVPYGLIITEGLEKHSREIVDFFRCIVDPVLARVGLHSSELGIFFGNSPATGFGVHQDLHGTIAHTVSGTKSLRYWTPDANIEIGNIAYRSAYESARSESEVMVARESGFMYWPQTYFHTGEAPDLELTCTVNSSLTPMTPLGVLHSAAAQFRTMLEGSTGNDKAPLKVMKTADGMIEFGETTQLLGKLEQFIGTAGRTLLERTAVEAFSAGGYFKAPLTPENSHVSVERRLRISTRICWHCDVQGIFVACDGHGVLLPPEAEAWFRRLMRSGVCDSWSRLPPETKGWCKDMQRIGALL